MIIMSENILRSSVIVILIRFPFSYRSIGQSNRSHSDHGLRFVGI